MPTKRFKELQSALLVQSPVFVLGQEKFALNPPTSHTVNVLQLTGTPEMRVFVVVVVCLFAFVFVFLR